MAPVHSPDRAEQQPVPEPGKSLSTLAVFHLLCFPKHLVLHHIIKINEVKGLNLDSVNMPLLLQQICTYFEL